MRAPAQPHRCAGARILEPPHMVDPGARRVDDNARVDRRSLLRRRAPLRRRRVPRAERSATTSAPLSTHAPASAAARTFPRQSRASFVVASAYSAHDRSPSRRSDGTIRPGLDRAPTSQLIRDRASSRVEDDPALHERRAVRAASVQGKEERRSVDEVRRDDLRQHAPLVVRLAHEADVPETEIAQPAVDELRRRARCCAAEVARVDERDGEARSRRMCRDRGTDDPGADDEQVEARSASSSMARSRARREGGWPTPSSPPRRSPRHGRVCADAGTSRPRADDDPSESHSSSRAACR